MMDLLNVGQIQLILGPMFSGKSTELIRRISRYTISEKKCVIIKYSKDNRYSNHDDKLYTHNKEIHEAISTHSLTNGLSIQIKEEYDVIGIDEGQFFTDLDVFCEEMCNHGKIVIIAALSGTFQRKSWKSVSNIIPLANEISHLTSICHKCKKDGASFTYRISQEEEITVIGGIEKYWAVCNKCYLLLIRQQQQ